MPVKTYRFAFRVAKARYTETRVMSLSLFSELGLILLGFALSQVHF